MMAGLKVEDINNIFKQNMNKYNFDKVDITIFVNLADDIYVNGELIDIEWPENDKHNLIEELRYLINSRIHAVNYADEKTASLRCEAFNNLLCGKMLFSYEGNAVYYKDAAPNSLIGLEKIEKEKNKVDIYIVNDKRCIIPQNLIDKSWVRQIFRYEDQPYCVEINITNGRIRVKSCNSIDDTFYIIKHPKFGSLASILFELFSSPDITMTQDDIWKIIGSSMGDVAKYETEALCPLIGISRKYFKDKNEERMLVSKNNNPEKGTPLTLPGTIIKLIDRYNRTTELVINNLGEVVQHDDIIGHPDEIFINRANTYRFFREDVLNGLSCITETIINDYDKKIRREVWPKLRFNDEKNEALDVLKKYVDERTKEPVDEGSKELPFLIIESEAGTGKSSLLINLCLDISKRPEVLPIYIPAIEAQKKRADETDTSISSFIVKKYTNYARINDTYVNFIKTLIDSPEKKHVLFLVDGLDEVSIECAREYLDELVDIYQKSTNKPTFIISTRYFSRMMARKIENIGYKVKCLEELNSKELKGLRKEYKTLLFYTILSTVTQGEKKGIDVSEMNYVRLFDRYIMKLNTKSPNEGLYSVFLPFLAYESLHNKDIFLSDIIANAGTIFEKEYMELYDSNAMEVPNWLKEKLKSSSIIQYHASDGEYVFKHKELELYLAAVFFSDFIQELPKKKRTNRLNAEVEFVLNSLYVILEEKSDNSEKTSYLNVSYGQYLVAKICDLNEKDGIKTFFDEEEKLIILKLIAGLGRQYGFSMYEYSKEFLSWFIDNNKLDTEDDWVIISEVSGMMYEMLRSEDIPSEELKEISLIHENLIKMIKKTIDEDHNCNIDEDVVAQLFSNQGAINLRLARLYYNQPMSAEQRDTIKGYLDKAIDFHNMALALRKKSLGMDYGEITSEIIEPYIPILEHIKSAKSPISLIRSYVCQATDEFYKGIYLGEKEAFRRAISMYENDAFGRFCERNEIPVNNKSDKKVVKVNPLGRVDEREKDVEGNEPFVLYTRLSGCYRLCGINPSQDLKCSQKYIEFALESIDAFIEEYGQEAVYWKYDFDIKRLLQEISDFGTKTIGKNSGSWRFREATDNDSCKEIIKKLETIHNNNKE